MKSECEEFFVHITSAEYKERKSAHPIQYLVKLGYGAHRAKGVFLLHEKNERSLLSSFQNGRRCGRKLKNLIAQTYIDDPLLLDKQNKFDFRIYLLVASTNPLIAYYHDGFLRVSLNAYDKDSSDVIIIR